MAGQPSDDSLMNNVRRGDQDALATLVRRHAAPLLSFVARLAGDRSAADDLFQDVWLAVWARRASYNTSLRFRPWLYRIAANRCADAARRRARSRIGLVGDLAGTPSPVAGPAESPIKAESIHAADAAVQDLPDIQRQVILLRLFASLEYGEIADLLGVRENTVRSHMSLALRSLRRALTPWIEARTTQETRDEHARP